MSNLDIDDENLYDEDDEEIYDEDGYDKNGFDKFGFHKVTGTEYDEYEYDKNGFDKEGFHKITGTKYDENNIDKNGNIRDENEDIKDEDEEIVDGFYIEEPRQYFKKHEHDKYGYDRFGFNADGIHKSTGKKYDEEGKDYWGNITREYFDDEKKRFIRKFGNILRKKDVEQFEAVLHIPNLITNNPKITKEKMPEYCLKEFEKIFNNKKDTKIVDSYKKMKKWEEYSKSVFESTNGKFGYKTPIYELYKGIDNSDILLEELENEDIFNIQQAQQMENEEIEKENIKLTNEVKNINAKDIAIESIKSDMKKRKQLEKQNKELRYQISKFQSKEEK